jgi:deoxyribonuclease V
LKLSHFTLNQLRIASRVKIAPLPHAVSRIAGVDVAVRHKTMIGCIAVFSYPDLSLEECAVATMPQTIPYIPGYLSFREIPVLLQCYKKLKSKPDMLLVDGQGIAHPRMLGLASHLGILLNKPTIGCAKSHLYGEYRVPGNRRGDAELLHHDRQRLGIVLRTRNGVKPLFVSPGHLVDIDDCKKFILTVTPKYRIPEPIRFAHNTAGETARRLHV